MNAWDRTRVHHFLDRTALDFRDRIAVVYEKERICYGELAEKADAFAHLLIEHTEKHDRVILLWENSPSYIVAYYAILKAGCIVVSLSTDSKPESLLSHIRDLEPRVIIASARQTSTVISILPNAETVRLAIFESAGSSVASTAISIKDYKQVLNIPAPNRNVERVVDGDDLAAIIYTSGSTGKPKGVMLSHTNIVENTKSICEYLKLSSDDVQMVVLPFFYVMGKSLLNTHFAVGGRVVLNNRFAFPAAVLKQMVDEQVTGFSGVPSTYSFLLNRSPLNQYRDQLCSLRYCSQAGGHMAKQIKLDLRKILPDQTAIVVMYGATEAAARLTYLDPACLLQKIDSIGRPIPNVVMRVLDEQGKELPSGEIGELVASGPNIMRGYWREGAATAKVLDGNGYHTGDLGYRDSDGFLFITGRKDSILKVGGHRINPQEIEDFLMETGFLIESAVIGMPDTLLGYRLVALGVFKNASTQVDDIMRSVAGKLPRYKLPERFIHVKELPKNSNGKLDRLECRKIIENQQI